MLEQLTQRIKQFINFINRQIFVKIKPDLKHRRGAAASQTFDARYSKFSVFRRFARFYSQAAANMAGNFRLAHYPA